MKHLFLAALSLVACTSMAAPITPRAPVGETDQCHASQYQSFVGRKIGDLPPKPEGEVWRQACTQCPMTMDFNPRRMNIIFDKDSEVIKEVKCG